MTKITRRAALSGFASLPAIAGATALPVALAAAETVTPHERFQAALAELKAAAEALDPRIYDWNVKADGKLCCSLAISAWSTTTEYEGDGWYDALYGGSDGDRVFVERAPEHDRNGERWFRITSYDRGRRYRAYTPEKSFNINYGRKLGEQRA